MKIEIEVTHYNDVDDVVDKFSLETLKFEDRHINTIYTYLRLLGVDEEQSFVCRDRLSTLSDVCYGEGFSTKEFGSITLTVLP